MHTFTLDMVVILTTFQLKTLQLINLDNNEAAFSLAVVTFTAGNNEQYLVVGTAADTFVAPRSCRSGYLRVYQFVDEGRSLELLHKVMSCGILQLTSSNVEVYF